MNDTIAQQIKSLQKEEAFRNTNLENVRKEELKYFLKFKNKVIDSADDFDRGLNSLSSIYGEISVNKNSFDFVSSQDTGAYELIDADLLEIINEHLCNLRKIEEDNEKKSDATETDYQSSLYMKYEAKMLEIEAMSELEKLNAEIKYLQRPAGAQLICESDETSHFSHILVEFGDHLKQLYTDQATLEIRDSVDAMLRVQQHSESTIDELVKLCKRRCARHKLRLAAINSEEKVHDDLLRVLESVHGLETLLVTINEQLMNMACFVTEEEHFEHSPDEQLLIRMRNDLTESMGDIVTCLESTHSSLNAVNSLKKENHDLVLQLLDNIENSKLFLEEIPEKVHRLYTTLKWNHKLGNDVARVSLVTDENNAEYSRLYNSSVSSQERLKTVKKEMERFRINVEL